MKKEFNKYGKKLTGQEYESAIKKAYDDVPSLPSRKDYKDLQKKKLNLEI